MKLNVDEDSNIPDITSVEHRNRISLPEGLFGFPEIREMELVFDQEELPFMWLREDKKDGLAFIVIEPGGLIPDYSVEITDADVGLLGVSGHEDTMILNIVTLSPDQSGVISLNLVGPIIINRTKLIGKQCIINNHEAYSSRHVIDLNAGQ